MGKRHGMIFYALEYAARPGARESRVRKPPEGARVRNERVTENGQA